jgi:Fe-S-cluster-containing dehydrogenase component
VIFVAEIVHPFGKKPRDQVWIDPVSCIGCGYCAIFCLMHCIHQRSDGFFEIDQTACIGCRSCRVNCPFEAVKTLSPEEIAP